MEKRLFVIVGAAGTGKSTVQDHLSEKYGMTKVITHTTRSPRKGEKDGVDYYFEDPQTFPHNHYLESVHYAHADYGSSYEGLEDAFQKSERATIILDTKGALTYLKRSPYPLTILYLELPDLATLTQRMLERGDTPEAVRTRVHSPEFVRDRQIPKGLRPYAHIVHSDDFTKTKERLAEIIAHL